MVLPLGIFQSGWLELFGKHVEVVFGGRMTVWRRIFVAQLVTLVLATFISHPAPAQTTLPTTPFLRIDAGMHTALINNMSLDASGEILATVSDDKTVRLWALPSGRLIDTLRVPIGDGTEGQLYAAMLTGSGNNLLIAGDTGRTWGNGISLNLFNVKRGVLTTVLQAPQGPILDIARNDTNNGFASSSLNGSVIVFNNRGQRQIVDNQFTRPVYDLSYSSQGWLAAASLDGQVKVYAPDLSVHGVYRAGAGEEPIAVDFSDDGTLLAIGYRTQPVLDIVQVSSLRLIRRLEAPTSDGGLETVTWARQGHSVYAGGSNGGAQGANVVLHWDADSGDLLNRRVVSDNTITDLISHPESGLIYATANPNWGWLGDDLSERLTRRSPVADFRNIHGGRFAVSDDGATVEFGTEVRGTRVMRFDFQAGTLSAVRDPDTRLNTGVTKTDRLTVEQWRDRSDTLVNGRPIGLTATEIVRSATVIEATNTAVIGTDFELKVIDGRGRTLSSIATPGAVWGLTFAKEANTVVAALADGTIRWYRLEQEGPVSLRETLALFISTSTNAWVAWSPEGFFDHSQIGGKSLVGYHFNTATNTSPIWIDFSEVYRLFYAPDLVMASLENRPWLIEAEIAKIGDPLARITAAPEAEVVSFCAVADTRALKRTGSTGHPAESEEVCFDVADRSATRGLNRIGATQVGSAADQPSELGQIAYAGEVPSWTTSIKLKIRVDETGTGLGNMDVFLNGRNAGRLPVTRASGELVERSVPVLPGLNRLSARVYDASGGTYQETGIIELTIQQAPATTERTIKEDAPNPEVLHVVAVGVDKHVEKSWNLNFARADASSFLDTVTDRAQVIYDDVAEYPLYDQEVTREAIIGTLREVSRQADNNDTLLIYLAGHGEVFPDDGLFYFITHDVPSYDQIPDYAVSEDDLVFEISQIDTRHGMVFMDTCYSGEFSLDNSAIMNHEMGRYILTASTSQEEALDSLNGENGVFAYAVLRGLNGFASGREDEWVDNLQLGTYVQRTVPRLAASRQHDQHAVFRTIQNDLVSFPLVPTGE